MKYPFDKIVIVYNPNSTGNSKTNAEKLVADLADKIPASIELLPTKYAGHGEEVAESYAKQDARVLLVSSSGDGGYHELVNGALSQANDNLATLVIPSGNANDHHHATVSDGQSPLDNLTSRIIKPKIIQLDSLKVEAQIEAKKWQRYAHSYVGIGLTAYIGKKMTEADLNPINEKIILLKYLLRFKSVSAKLDNGPWRRYSSLLFGNIGRMSKVLTLGENTKPDDGKFEIYQTPASSTLGLIGRLLIGSLDHIDPDSQAASAKFMTKHTTDLQCDGEVFSIDGQSQVTISMAVGAIRTLA